MNMSPFVVLAWHFGGLAVAATGAALLNGWPGAMIIVGLWAVVATIADAFARRLNK